MIECVPYVSQGVHDLMTTKFNFTHERLAKLTPPEKGEINFHDLGLPGLTVRLRPNGSGQFIVRYRLKGVATPKRLTLGNVSQTSLADARQRAREVITLAKSGKDPSKALLERAAGEGGSTLGDIINTYEQEQSRAKIKYASADAALLRREFSKLLLKPARALTRRDFVAVIKKIRDGVKKDGKLIVDPRPAAATKSQALLHGALETALGDGVVDVNVLSGLRAKRGSRKQKNITQATKAARALDINELSALWRACDDHRVTPVFGLLVQFLIITGCRRNEAALAQRAWLKAPTGGIASVSLPGAITKNGLSHEVFLPELFSSKLKAFLATHNEALLFPGRRKRDDADAPAISGWSKRWPSLLTIAKEYGLSKSATPHDLRRSLRTGYEALGVNPRVAERQLNHVSSDKLDAIYNQHDYRAERIDAANKWAQALIDALDSHNILSAVA